MTSTEKIEALLQKEGLTLETLQNRKDYKEEQCSAVYLDIPCEIWSLEREILHQRDVIELLIKALKKAQTERDAAIEDAKARACIVCKHNDNHAGEEPCKSCHKLRNWEWRGQKQEGENNE